nr:hypothetical protein [Tanacetum cinerariifolium]
MMNEMMAWMCRACDDLVKDYLYENKDPEEDEFKEEEEPQEEEGIYIDDEEDENELELTFPYEGVDPLNPSPLAFDSELKDVIDVEDMVEPEDEIVPASVYEGKAKDEYYGKLILDLGNEVRSSVEEGMTAIENLVKKSWCRPMRNKGCATWDLGKRTWGGRESA